MVFRAVDVRGEAGDRVVVIDQQLDGVSAQDRHPAEVFREGDRLGQGRADVGVKDVGVVGESLHDLGHCRGQSGELVPPPAREPRSADQQVEQQADPRLEEDEE